ncbi:hypothetical protein MKW94_016354 [Papaver nudicaule]|uniref:DUF642 domain-containing protein n=1 Tax=Papaver nudicaule TaxID=74823 RepID=A0AA41SEJ2_PAPNU|nr:hypothetical protein [Papaver nudicaule]
MFYSTLCLRITPCHLIRLRFQRLVIFMLSGLHDYLSNSQTLDLSSQIIVPAQSVLHWLGWAGHVNRKLLQYIIFYNAVINGDFEEGPWVFRNTSLGVLLPTHLDEETTTLPGWIIESNRAVRYVDSNHFDVPQGKRAIELLSGKEGIISQMVETKPDKKYSLTFAFGHAGDSCQQQPLAIMAFAGDQAQNIHYMPTANRTYDTANVTFTAKAERTRIAFYSVYYNQRSDDKSSLCGPVVDDVKVWDFTRSSTSRMLSGGLSHLALLFSFVLSAFIY